jgi:DNA polymerase-1
MFTFKFKKVQSLPMLNGKSLHTRNRVIIVDFSWVLHKSLHAFSWCNRSIEGCLIPVGDVHGSFYTIINILKKYPLCNIFLCIEGKTNRRKKMFPEYKAQRDKNKGRQAFSKRDDILQAICTLPCTGVAYLDEWEADDTMFTLAKVFEREGHKCSILTRDKDLYQAISDNVNLWDGKAFTGAKEVLKKMKVPVNDLAMFRALKGDPSDNLKGYFRIPTTVAIEISSLYKTPSDLLDFPSKSTKKNTKKWIDRIKEDPNTLMLNYRMMKLKPRRGVRIIRPVNPNLTLLDKWNMPNIKKCVKSMIEGK